MAATLAARDVTSHFLKYRMEFKSKKYRFGKSLFSAHSLGSATTYITSPYSSRGQQRLLSTQSDDEDGVEMTTALHQLPPLWADMVEEAHDDISRIKEKMSQLQKTQQRRLLKVFVDSEGEGNSDREIDQLTSTLTLLFRECESKVQQICKPKTTEGETRCDQLMQKNAQRSIAAQLQALNSAFRKQQKTYLAEIKRRTHGGDLFGEDDRSTADLGFSDEMVSELVYVERETNLRQGVRDQIINMSFSVNELTKIAQSVADLHQIFKDLSNLVIEQGTIVDRIDYNVEQVLQNTTQANVELRKAEERQKSGRAANCIIALLFTIFILIDSLDQLSSRTCLLIKAHAFRPTYLIPAEVPVEVEGSSFHARTRLSRVGQRRGGDPEPVEFEEPWELLAKPKFFAVNPPSRAFFPTMLITTKRGPPKCGTAAHQCMLFCSEPQPENRRDRSE